jgi:hypothetical protein
MATKVAESMAMRRAFDVAAPSQDERWDVESASANYVAPPQQSLAEKAAQQRASLDASLAADAARQPEIPPPVDADATPEPVAAPEQPTDAVRCDEPSPYDAGSEACAKEKGHKGSHRNHDKETW